MAATIRLKGLADDRVSELLPDGLILLGFRGSIAHDMYVPKNDPDSIDDKDVMGVFVAPVEHYLGFGRSAVKEKFVGEWDAVSYEVRKFIGLLLKCNPNVLSMLWLPDQHVIFAHELGRYLKENRDTFVSKVAYHSFSGYAHGQFKRMTHFNQDAQRELAEIESIVESHGVDVGGLSATQTQRDIRVSEGKFSGVRLGELIDRCRGLRNMYYSGGYMGAKRRELVRRVGYDAKNAAHLIRLLRMGIEFLVEGELHVARADSEQLLSVKRGEWSLDRVKEEAERLFRLAEEAYVRSSLPPKPDAARAEVICTEIIRRYHGFHQ
ncbi:MAG TPA: nucleotidyltransferase domain-containing protein [Blastocatellia bacterium]|nr:nucleotidyltransferase domain-containing protein [Blastocatellia bacterium]